MGNKTPTHEPAAPLLAAYDREHLLSGGDIVTTFEGVPIAVERESSDKLSQVSNQTVSSAHLLGLSIDNLTWSIRDSFEGAIASPFLRQLSHFPDSPGHSFPHGKLLCYRQSWAAGIGTLVRTAST